MKKRERERERGGGGEEREMKREREGEGGRRRETERGRRREREREGGGGGGREREMKREREGEGGRRRETERGRRRERERKRERERDTFRNCRLACEDLSFSKRAFAASAASFILSSLQGYAAAPAVSIAWAPRSSATSTGTPCSSHFHPSRMSRCHGAG